MTALWIILGVLVVVAVYDLVQTRHAILRNFPIIGHFRYLLESIGPELRRYIVTDNDEERPFSRDQRRWVYTSSKLKNNYFGFGTDNELEAVENYVIAIQHAVFPYGAPTVSDDTGKRHYRIPSTKILGGPRQRKHAFRPDSVVNVSGMSYGSLSGPATEAINRGCSIAGCLHNTGEGGVADHHLHGGDLIWQIGTGYFGCRDENGKFSLDRLKETIAGAPIKALEIKLSQGAKPGHGGILPAAKITPEISRVRGIPMGQDCLSPASHSAFHDVDSMLDFVEKVADATGLPVGIKSAVGEIHFWQQLAEAMDGTGRGVDFITIDGGEGGTGAAPLVFSDHVAYPFRIGFARVYRQFAERGIQDEVTFIGSGKLGFPDTATVAFALGCDMVQLGREVMMAVGCIQAQRCHNGHCPTGVATQNRWLVRGLDPRDKGARLGNYLLTLRKELINLAHACGVPHPAAIPPDRVEILDGQFGSRSIQQVFDYEPSWSRPPSADVEATVKSMGAPKGVTE